jgi:hypothetical protein
MYSRLAMGRTLSLWKADSCGSKCERWSYREGESFWVRVDLLTEGAASFAAAGLSPESSSSTFKRNV